MRPSGDSLLAIPLLLPRDTAIYRVQMEEVIRRGLRRVAMDTALRITEAWLAANPSEQRAKMMRAATLLSLGRVTEAYDVMRGAAVFDSTNAGANAFLATQEMLIKLWRGNEAFKLYDSLRAHAFVMRGGANPITVGNILATIAPVFGQMSVFDSLIAISTRGAPASRYAFSRSLLRTMAGMPVDSFTTLLTTVFNEASAGGAGVLVSRQMAPYLLIAARTWPASQWPQLDTAVNDLRTAPAIAIQRGDTAALRRAARKLDSVSNVLTSATMPDSGHALSAALAYLALRDSTAALRMARRWLDTSVTIMPILVGQNATSSQVQLPGAMLLRADLAAALGYRDEARLWYGRFLAFWSHADADAKPLLDRVRSAYAATGGS